jgi:hypothetical protein
MMITLIVMVLCLVAVWKVIRRLEREDFFPAVFFTFIAALLAAFLYVPLAAFEGVYPGYGTGERVGIVAKVSKKGVIWKTWEIDVLVSSENVSVPGVSFSCSTPDDEMGHEFVANIGRRCVLGYDEWFIGKYANGSEGHIVRSVKWVDNGKP